MSDLGILRVAAAVPALQLAVPCVNAARHRDLLRQAADAGVRLVVFPECSLTGYTCGDLFHQSTLLQAAEDSLGELTTAAFPGVAVVGLPVALDGMVFNAAAVLQEGRLLGVVPKSFLPNYREYYDARYFAPARNSVSNTVTLAGQSVPFGTDILFECSAFSLGVEICEDLWMPIPPSSRQALAGATVLVNLSASHEAVGKADYRRQLVAMQSGRCLAGYVYSGAGVGESSTDFIFSGHSLVAANGTILAESQRFRRNGHLTIADIDLQHLERDRSTTTSFNDARDEDRREYRRVLFSQLSTSIDKLLMPPEAHPFVPSNPATLAARCDEIFHAQVAGLARRLEAANNPTPCIGVSGGLDSTLALLVLCKTMDALGKSRSNIRGFTLPGFGTGDRTKANAKSLMKLLGVTAAEIDIRPLAYEQMKSLGHKPFGIDLARESLESFVAKLKAVPAGAGDLGFENTQARVRTSLLMNAGFVVGTGDLSELCLGWCTYNADHMSMYNVNVSVPKTLVKFLVRWAAQHEFEGDARRTLLDIADTVISPELLPGSQPTEAAIGPYELHDFFLYHLLRWGSDPAKILFLSKQAKFDRDFGEAEIRQWLTVFLKRFFASQFKRSCLPDGPKIGSVSISPRGDWRMPSDASVQAWLDVLD